jgi:Tfp pilus assembly protein PilV
MSMKGFTLVETLVAVTVVLMAIMGPFQLVKDALTASYVARDQLIATALAEEGVEYVRSVRDGNYLYNINNPGSERDWLYGLNGSGNPNCFATNGCVVDPIQNTVQACGQTCPVLRTTSASLYTQQVSGTATRFTRKVVIENVAAGREVRVTVSVTFTSRHTPFTVTVTDNLHNWL